MPISAAGNRAGGKGGRIAAWQAAGRRRRAAAGFTLLELIVVMAIVALGTAAVALSLRDSSQSALDREAERLAALLESARAQSRTNGVAVRWRLTPEGPGSFTFDGLPAQALPNAWQNAGISAQPIDANGQAVAVLQLGPEPIIPAQQVELDSEGPPSRSVRIGTDGLHPFTVLPP
jgi:general secretion pathway protein H